MQREKGKRYERQIAALLRTVWPDVDVRRSSQAERAYQSDVYISGGPSVLGRLWLECQDARNPTPLAKLEQAERDIAAHARRDQRVPIVIWHRFGERQSYVTIRLWALDELRGVRKLTGNPPVTLALMPFVGLLLDVSAQEGRAS